MHPLLLSLNASLRPSLNSAWWIIRITLPVSLIMTLLQYFGIIQEIAVILEPAFKLIGLRGEAALVLATSFFINIYSAIAVMVTIPFTGKEVTIMALMCLIAHNLIVETAIQKKTGSGGIRMFTLRIITAFAAGALLHGILQENGQQLYRAIPNDPEMAIGTVLTHWVRGSLLLVLRLVLIITGLNFLQKTLETYGLLGKISKGLSPLMKFFGLNPANAMLWLIANVVGLTYGSAILVSYKENNLITPADADLLNHHLAISHSLLEDTLLFTLMGVSVFWLTIPRILLATLIVRSLRFIPPGNPFRKQPVICRSAENHLGL